MAGIERWLDENQKYKLRGLMSTYGATDLNELLSADKPAPVRELAARLIEKAFDFPVPREQSTNIFMEPDTRSRPTTQDRSPLSTNRLYDGITEQNIDPREVVPLDMEIIHGGLVPQKQPPSGFALPVTSTRPRVPPPTEADYTKSLRERQDKFYGPSQEASIAGIESEIKKREYDLNQGRRATQFGRAIADLFSNPEVDITKLSSKDITALVDLDPELDPLTKQRVFQNFGVDPKEAMKSEKWRWANKQIQENPTKIRDVEWLSKNVFDQLDPDQALGMVKHLTKAAGTVEKETLSDMELKLVKKVLVGQPLDSKEGFIFNNLIMARLNMEPLLQQMYFMSPGKMMEFTSPDPNIKAKAQKDLIQFRKDYIQNWMEGIVSKPEPVPQIAPPVGRKSLEDIFKE